MNRAKAARSISGLAVLFFAAGVLAAGAQSNPPPAQDSTLPNALQGFARNRNEPVKIDANRLEVHDQDKVAIFSGNVFVQQGDTNMRCPELRVFYEGEVAPKKSDGAAGETKSETKSGAPQKVSTTENSMEQRIKRLEALGGVIVTSKDQKATGDRADFDMKTKVVVLNGNVVVTQGPNVMKGDRLVVDLQTSRARMEAGTKGNPGRVQGLFLPSSAKDNADTKKGKPPKGQTQQTAPQ